MNACARFIHPSDLRKLGAPIEIGSTGPAIPGDGPQGYGLTQGQAKGNGYGDWTQVGIEPHLKHLVGERIFFTYYLLYSRGKQIFQSISP